MGVDSGSDVDAGPGVESVLSPAASGVEIGVGTYVKTASTLASTVASIFGFGSRDPPQPLKNNMIAVLS